MSDEFLSARPTLPRRIAMRLFPAAVARRDAKMVAQAQLTAMPKLVADRLDDLARVLDAISQTLDRQSEEIGLLRSGSHVGFESIADSVAILSQGIAAVGESVAAVGLSVAGIGQSVAVVNQNVAAVDQKVEVEAHASGARAVLLDEASRALSEVERQVADIKEAMLELAGSELASLNLGHEQIEILRRLDAANLLPTSKR